MHEPDNIANIPASGAWREGDRADGRRFADLGTILIESGCSLPVTLAYETFGTLSSTRDNAVLILHALTGDTRVDQWWPGVVGPGKAIDTDRYFVVVPNVLGGCQGSTGPATVSPDGDRWNARFPQVTTRDQVLAESLLADALGIETFALVVGASMGGHRALEWAISRPQRVARLAVIASGSRTTAEQIALGHTQLLAIYGDPHFCLGSYYDRPDGAGPWRGLSLARAIAHVSYRSELELDSRFGRLPQGGEEPRAGGRFAVQSYLDHQGVKLARRFDANSYVTLTRAMMTHDVGRDRGGVREALAQVQADTLVVAIDSDRLFTLRESQLLADAIPWALPLRVVSTPVGHDGFLLETDTIGRWIAELLAGSRTKREERQY